MENVPTTFFLLNMQDNKKHTLADDFKPFSGERIREEGEKKKVGGKLRGRTGGVGCKDGAGKRNRYLKRPMKVFLQLSS